MRIAMIYGRMSSGIHNNFDVIGLYDTQALTGSETSFFNLAWGLSERGHQVDVFCATKAPVELLRLSGAHIYPLETPIGKNYNVYFTWNEPDQLRNAPKESLRICAQQLNDFDYCAPDFADYVDLVVMPSEVHRRYLISGRWKLPESKTRVIPNSINLEFFEQQGKRPSSIVYCSSPDRGLHRLLEIFPRVRARVRDANLKIFYRFDPWYQNARTYTQMHEPGLATIGRRARYIGECLDRLGRNGENGVYLIGPKSTHAMAIELCQAKVLAYTCDPIRFTEGFSVSTMDACAAQCRPIISDRDAIGDIYKDVALVIPGRPGDHLDEWVDAICRNITSDDEEPLIKARAFAERYARQKISAQWEDMIEAHRMGLTAPRTMFEAARP